MKEKKTIILEKKLSKKNGPRKIRYVSEVFRRGFREISERF